MLPESTKEQTVMTTQVRKTLYFDEVKVGDKIPQLTKEPVTHLQLVRYAGASGDFNPLHTDPKVGEMIGTGGIIAHGMLIMGFVGQMLSNYVGPQALKSFGVRFKGMTHLNDVITCSGSITKKYEENGEARVAGEGKGIEQDGDVKVAGNCGGAFAPR